MSDITRREFHDICEAACAKQREIKKLEEEIEKHKVELSGHKAKIQAILEADDQKTYDLEGCAKFTITERYSVRVPKNHAQKKELLDYLTDRGLYWDFVTVGSADIKQLFDEEMKKAQERGDPDFKFPGIDGGLTCAKNLLITPKKV